MCDPDFSVNPIDEHLFTNGVPASEEDLDRTFELYKLMVTSSENLVARRQGVNTFFLTVDGLLLTAAGLLVSNGTDLRLTALSLVPLTVTGLLLSLAWRSLIVSFGQLNSGKFEVINRLEGLFPAAVYFAEWKMLGEGSDPRRYLRFTSREVWVPWTFLGIFGVATIAALTTVLVATSSLMICLIKFAVIIAP